MAVGMLLMIWFWSGFIGYSILEWQDLLCEDFEDSMRSREFWDVFAVLVVRCMGL